MFKKQKLIITKHSTLYATRSTRGFSIIEMIVAVAIFSIVMVVCVGALLSVVDVNQRVQSIKSIVNNLNYALESMVRNIRTGSNYDCDLIVSGSQDCPSAPGSAISFTDQRGHAVIYRRDASTNTIKRDLYLDGNLNLDPETLDLTDPVVLIDRLNFYVKEASSDQPNVVILVGGYMALKGGNQVRFDIETLAVQRLFNQ